MKNIQMEEHTDWRAHRAVRRGRPATRGFDSRSLLSPWQPIACVKRIYNVNKKTFLIICQACEYELPRVV